MRLHLALRERVVLGLLIGCVCDCGCAATKWMAIRGFASAGCARLPANDRDEYQAF